MPTNTPSRAKLPIMIAAWLLVAVIALIGSGLAGNAQAQAGSNVIPSITLDSNQPGQLVITWATPEQAPTDYRIRWANTNLGFPSYSAANEPERGNEYPLVDVNTLTLSNLTPGDSYKVQIRSRYYNADGSVHESSGPWTSTATQRVKDNPPAAPTGLTASLVEHNSLTLNWNDPQDTNITGYRIQRGTDANSLHTIEANTGSASTEYQDATVEPETTYHYAVVALSANGDSPQSSSMSATTPAAPKSKDPPPQRVGARQSITTEVPANWSLKPTGLTTGNQFRLMFLSSTKRNGTPGGISTYNTFIQTLAAAGHTHIQSYSTGFRVVGCTNAVDARDNTSTTGTGVAIYWLNGNKVADDYADFYDGDWDDEANDKNESGSNGLDTSLIANHPITGCDHDGTKKTGANLGSNLDTIVVGQPNSSNTGAGPLTSQGSAALDTVRPMYGLSGLFQVAAASTDATLSALTVSPKDINGFASDRASYEVGVASTVTQATIVATKNDSAATVGYSTTDADGTTDGHQVRPISRAERSHGHGHRRGYDHHPDLYPQHKPRRNRRLRLEGLRRFRRPDHSRDQYTQRPLVGRDHHVGGRLRRPQDLRLQPGHQGARCQQGLRYPHRRRQRGCL